MARTPKKEPHHPPEHWEKLLYKEFKGESDRACVILGAALLDSALETLLRTFLIPSSTAEDALFDGANASLATFSSRIEMAARLGLIDVSFARGLHLVRRIRNDFAHNVTGCTFGDSAVLSRVTELRRVSGLPENEPSFRDSYPDGPRGDFQYIVSFLQWMLRSGVEDVEKVSPSETLSGYYFPVPKKRERKKRKPTAGKTGAA
jgi:hypothetical protein